jgi:aminocarboxymuconate-semialdehyde decarboxylase
MWATLEDMGLLVFMHSTTAVSRDALSEYTLNTVVGWPTETSICVARLIFSGTLERHPRLNLVLSHGGGTLPYLRGRLNLAYHAPHYEANPACRTNISKPPGDYFDQLYFDTVVASPDSLRFLLDLVGPDRVMFGSDFPFEIGDAEGFFSLPVIDTLPADQRDRVLSGNAGAILEKVAVN